VSAEFESERPTVVPAGESAELRYPVGNGGLVPTRVFLEPASDGVEVRPAELSVSGRSVANATVALQAPPETGYYRRYVTEHRYLAVLPAPVIRGLHALHPWAPVVAIDALLGGTFYLLGTALVGTGRVRARSRRRELPLSTRVRRWLRRS
jgi:signal peptidase